MNKITILLSLFLVMSGIMHAQVQARIGTVTDAFPGTEITIPVYLSGFSSTASYQLSAIDFRIFCDTSIATYNRIEISNSYTNLSEWVSNGVNGSLRANWLEPNFGSISFPDNTPIIDFVLDYKGGNATLAFELCILADVNLNPIENIELISGSITQAAGSGTTLWNGTGVWTTTANWSNGVPGDSAVARIVTGQLEVANSAVCKTLTIETGTTLIIKPGGSLTVNDTLINNGSLIAEADATLYGSLIINKKIQQTGSTTIQRIMEAGKTYGLGSMVANGSASAFIGSGTLSAFAENQNAFSALTGSTLSDGIGYLFASSGNNLLETEGQPLVSLPAKTLAYTTGGSAATSGWNYLANPFTSAFSLAEGLTLTNADKTVYAWDNGRYHVWNGTTGTLTNGIIPYGWAFFVKANSAGGQITLKKEGKQHAFSAFSGNLNTTATILPLTVTVFEAVEKTDVAFIQLDENANFGFDNQYDAWKLPNAASMPELYLYGDNGIKLAVNAIPFAPATMKLGFKAPEDGAYTIAAPSANIFNPGSPVQLYDKLLDATKDLRTENHFFSSEAGTFNDRFELILSGVGIEDPEMQEHFLIFAVNSSIRIKALSEVNESVMIQVRDIKGSLLSSQTAAFWAGSEIKLPSSSGIRIVTVQTTKELFTVKVIVQ
ncbi:MAG: hypothetical protein PHQ65_11835 [Bacteroidales bacterium]|nr:hypothetical protein [Bacteroidales bacterium]MDD3665948.1 hypothetical protein [Bacteroidales bacterium]